MGRLFYADSPQPIIVADRLLAHLKVVITTKLRRRESFTLNTRHESDATGRSSLWLQESIPLRFEFESAQAEELDPALLREFAEQATMSGGLTIDLLEWSLDEELTEQKVA